MSNVGSLARRSNSARSFAWAAFLSLLYSVCIAFTILTCLLLMR